MSENYDAVNLTEMYEEAERFDEQGDGGNTDFLAKFVIMPEREGFVVVRLLPPVKGKKFFCATRTHRLVKDPKAKKGGKNLHCPREIVIAKSGKKIWVDNNPKDPCPICMWTRGIWAEVEAAGKESPAGKVLHEEYSRIKAIERCYYNCVVRHYNENMELVRSEGPKILSIGKTLHERIVRAMTGDKKAGKKPLGDVSDLKTGRDFKIVKKLRPGSTFPYYDESTFEDPSPLGDSKEVEAWLSQMHDLASLRVVKPTSEISVALKQYTGVLPSEETSFDMDQYRKKAESVEEKVAEVIRETKPAVAAPPAQTMDAADFFADLDNLATK